MVVSIPTSLLTTCRKSPERLAWLEQLPDRIREFESRWSLRLRPPFEGPDVSGAWVARVRRADGSAAVLKLPMPHMEGDQEIAGLRFWHGDPTVRLLDADDDRGVMLLEECVPGTSLRGIPETQQDVVLAELLRRLWQVPPAGHPFRPLSAMTEAWSNETLANAARWPDPALVRAGLELFRELPRSANTAVLLATDLHAGNVLAAEREPWLVIDPKPFVGDPAYDATQHLFNCPERMRANPLGLIRRFANLLGVDHDRVRLWTFARAAAEPRDDWDSDDRMALARAIAP